MANQVNKDAIVRFLTGYEDNLSEVDIENGTVYFALKPDPLNPFTKTIGSIYLDANNQRIMMSGESLATLDEVGDRILTKYIKGIDFDANSNAEATNNGAKGILTYVKGNGADVNVDVPSASATAAGFVTTGSQTFAGAKTFTGIVHLSNKTDASGASDSGVLIIGDKNGEHLIFDGNEIMSKNKTTRTGTLYLNNDGGTIQVGGSINPNSNKTLNLGSATNYWKEAYISNLITNTLSGHLTGSLTGNVTGNASSASKWLTARKVTMTGDVTGNFTLNGTQDVSYAASIANYSLKPVKLAVHDYANYSQLNRHTAASWGFSVDTTDANGAIYTMTTLARNKFISEEFPCSGGEKFIITYEISTSCKGNSTSGGTDSTYRGTAIGLYGYQKANKTTSAGIAYSTRVTGTADAPWTKVSSVVTTPTAARFFYVFVQTESWGNFSGSIRIRNLEVRRASGLDNAGDEILTKYLTRVAFTQENVSKKLNLQVYNGNNALKATVQVPNASTTEAGVVNTGTQSFAGNKTFTGRIHFSNTTDAAKGSDSGVITIGDKSGEHMLLDGNEIMAKSGASGANVLHIQAEGGPTEIGGNFTPKSQLSLGSSSNYWGNAYIKNLVADTLSGHLTGSLTGNLTGNASSATKLQTARKIVLGNDLQGEVSFDGTKDVTFTASNYYSTISGGNTQNYPWRRIATSGTITDSRNDRDMVIAIRHSYNGGGYGIAKVSLRTNNVSSNAVSQCEIRWLVRQNISLDALQAGFRNVAGDTYADIFYKVGAWPRARVYQLQGDRTWTLISSNEANDTTTSDKKTSSEAYATIAAAATALSRTYTSTVTAVDQGYVERAYKDESGNNIRASYLAAIQQVTSDKDTFTFRGFNKNNGAMNNLITIPGATAADANNANWKAGLVTSQAQTWAGNKTFKGALTVAARATVDTLKISKTEAAKHIEFARGDFNYIATAANGCIAFLPNGASTGEETSRLIVEDGGARPGATNTYNLGTSGKRWKNIYGNALNISGTSTLTGAVTLGGNLSVGGTLGVTGATTLSSTLTVTGKTVLSSVVEIGNDLTAKGNIFISNSNPYIQFTDTANGNQVYYIQGYQGNLYLGSTSTKSPKSPWIDKKGVLHTISDQYTDNTTAGLNLHNSNIVGVNSIYTAGASKNSQEGIHFYRDAKHVDTIRVAEGVMYFTPNRTIGNAGTSYYIARTATENGNVGSTNTLTYVEGGVIKATSENIGKGTQAVYMASGQIKASTSSVGGSTTPMYLRNGIMTSCDYGVGALHATEIFDTTKQVFLLGTSSSSIGYRTTTYFDPRIYITTGSGELSCLSVESRGNLYGGNNIYLRNGTFGEYARLYVRTPGTACTTNGIAGATGVTYMYLGNKIAVSTTAGSGANNSCGVLRIYGSSTGYTDIRCGTNNTNECTLYLPGATGQIVFHDNNAPIGGPDTPVCVTAAGRVMPCSTNLTDYVLKAGDTMTGNLAIKKASGTTSFTTERTDTKVSVTFGVGSDGTNRGVYDNSLARWIIYSDGTDAAKTGLKLCGAVWNDYAEFRQTKDKVEPGRVVIETGRGDLKLSTERLQPGANVVSDTFGFAIGETKKAKTPLAVAGRVLVYTFEDKYSYKPGDAVCTGPNGTVSKMTREEIWKYPERIVGTVSEIPEYEIWESGDGPIQVNSRIWIKVK